MYSIPLKSKKNLSIKEIFKKMRWREQFHTFYSIATELNHFYYILHSDILYKNGNIISRKPENN
jgi:hypothetical protein